MQSLCLFYAMLLQASVDAQKNLRQILTIQALNEEWLCMQLQAHSKDANLLP